MYDDPKPPPKLGRSTWERSRDRTQAQRLAELKAKFPRIPVVDPKHRKKRDGLKVEIVHATIPSDMATMLRAEGRNKGESLTRFIEQAISAFLRSRGYGPMLDGLVPIPDDLRILGQKHPGLVNNPGRLSDKAKTEAQQAEALFKERQAVQARLKPTWRDGILCKPGITINDVVQGWRRMSVEDMAILEALDLIPPKPV